MERKKIDNSLPNSTVSMDDYELLDTSTTSNNGVANLNNSDLEEIQQDHRMVNEDFEA